MPAPPEIGETDRGVRKTEVVLQMKTKSQSSADGASRITGEIEKDLSGKRDHARPGIERYKRAGITEDAIGRTGQQSVGEDNFLEQPKSH